MRGTIEHWVSPFRRVLRYLRPHAPAFVIGVVCIPVTTGLDLWLVRAVGKALDRLAGAAGARPDTQPGGVGDAFPDESFLWRIAALLLGVAVVQLATRFVTRKFVIGASRQIERDIKDDVFRHLNRLPFRWFDKAKTGDILSRVTQDVELLRFMVGPAPMYGGAILLLLPGALIAMLFVSPMVTAITLVTFALMLMAMRVQFRRLDQKSQVVQEAIAKLSDKAFEDFSGIRVLKAFARETAEVVEFARTCQACVAANEALTRTRARLHLLINGSREIGILFVLVAGYVEVRAGRMTPGDVFAFFLYLGLLNWPLIAAGWILAAIPRARAAAVRVEEIFNEPPEEPDGVAAAASTAPAPIRGAIAVRNLTFGYGDPKTPSLTDVSFDLPAGRTLGICGPVGSGKSTLLSLLARLYDPPRGTVLLDGRDVLDIPLARLRSAFAFAPQDVFLFSDSIRGNVGFARDEESVDAALLARAAEVSALSQDLAQFPQGLDQVVGERGLTLSGGQKQRVSLARALASDRPILVLDDTLSAVDHATEKAILGGLRAARSDRTALLVAHRLSVVRDADLILWLDAGRVAERGSHAELLAAGGAYARTWARQQAAAELEEM